MNLYLMRHAIAADADANTPDSRRPLTEKGREKLRRIARNLHILEIKVDLILVSPYLRTRQTAAVLADALDLPPDKVVETPHLTPDGDARQLIAELNARHGLENVLLVSHEPFISQLISLLLSGDDTMDIEIKKASICKLSISSLTHGRCARLDWLLTPSQLIALQPN